MKETVQTQSAPQAIGPYAQAIATESMLFTSGQLGIDHHTGKLADGVEKQAALAMQNLGAILSAKNLTYQNIVKTTIVNLLTRAYNCIIVTYNCKALFACK